MSIPLLYGDPTTVNDIAPTAKVGGYYWYWHATYGWWKLRYLQLLNPVTTAAGQVNYPVALDGSTVTNDITGGTSVPWAVVFAGLSLRALTASYFGYFLVGGRYPTIKTSGADDIAAGECLICHGSTDGTCDGVAANAPTVAALGIANTADIDADNTVDGVIGPVGGYFHGP